MTMLGKFTDGLAADALARGIGRGQFWMSYLEIEQLAIQPIVIPIADRRFGQHIVGMIVPAQFLRQRCMAFIRLSRAHNDCW